MPMDEPLKTIAINAGLKDLVNAHPELVEAAWKRARVYAGRLEALELTDEPAQIFKAGREVQPE